MPHTLETELKAKQAALRAARIACDDAYAQWKGECGSYAEYAAACVAVDVALEAASRAEEAASNDDPYLTARWW